MAKNKRSSNKYKNAENKKPDPLIPILAKAVFGSCTMASVTDLPKLNDDILAETIERIQRRPLRANTKNPGYL